MPEGGPKAFVAMLLEVFGPAAKLLLAHGIEDHDVCRASSATGDSSKDGSFAGQGHAIARIRQDSSFDELLDGLCRGTFAHVVISCECTVGIW